MLPPWTAPGNWEMPDLTDRPGCDMNGGYCFWAASKKKWYECVACGWAPPCGTHPKKNLCPPCFEQFANKCSGDVCQGATRAYAAIRPPRHVPRDPHGQGPPPPPAGGFSSSGARPGAASSSASGAAPQREMPGGPPPPPAGGFSSSGARPGAASSSASGRAAPEMPGKAGWPMPPLWRQAKVAATDAFQWWCEQGKFLPRAAAIKGLQQRMVTMHPDKAAVHGYTVSFATQCFQEISNAKDFLAKDFLKTAR